jgi:hypothetical protein
MHSEEDGRSLLLLVSPIRITEFTTRKGTSGYKVEPWLKTSREDLFVVNMDDVLTMSESKDIDMILMHQEFNRRLENVKRNKPDISRKMGYISSVAEAKEILEKLFNNS